MLPTTTPAPPAPPPAPAAGRAAKYHPGRTGPHRPMTARLLVVGDTHANTAWWRAAVDPAVAATGCQAVIQVGDFGYWADARDFLDAAAACRRPVLFVDGNHEDHALLAAEVAATQARRRIDDPTAPVRLAGSLAYLPRGGRIDVAGVRVAALGGAHSIDRAGRRPGVDWFDAEDITEADLARLVAGGPADVLVTHDAPAGHPIAGVDDTDDDRLPAAWQAELPACRASRRAVRSEAWAPVVVVGLGRDGDAGALAVVDLAELAVHPVATMPPPPAGGGRRCGYCGLTDDVVTLAPVDYPVCRHCRIERGIDARPGGWEHPDDVVRRRRGPGR